MYTCFLIHWQKENTTVHRETPSSSLTSDVRKMVIEIDGRKYSNLKLSDEIVIFANSVHKLQLELIYLYFPPSFHQTVVVSVCRSFVFITTLSTSIVGVEVTSVSWLGQLKV
jgi:hypothetical protein